MGFARGWLAKLWKKQEKSINTTCLRCHADTTGKGWYIGEGKTLCVPCGPVWSKEKRANIHR